MQRENKRGLGALPFSTHKKEKKKMKSCCWSMEMMALVDGYYRRCGEDAR